MIMKTIITIMIIIIMMIIIRLQRPDGHSSLFATLRGLLGD